ncbi:hypothetical protein BpHYR1_045525 [Brachionus plicatilis]|uniref:Uncharacterized protein n=1 Tax=Brachionus plicatilis TaxID=10195 RepID=A0A3M7SG63_BRAPC|nr:hypothetical protein BpHYR1_045525 [Brachionus plicatilis]
MKKPTQEEKFLFKSIHGSDNEPTLTTMILLIDSSDKPRRKKLSLRPSDLANFPGFKIASIESLESLLMNSHAV